MSGRIRIGLLLSALLLAWAAPVLAEEAGKDHEYPEGIEKLVSAEVSFLDMEKNKSTGTTVFTVETTIQNDSEENLMEIEYVLSVYDKDNKEMDHITMIWNGQDTPLPPQEETIDKTGWQMPLERDADHVDVTVNKASTEEEVPPIHLPKKGEYLYQAIDQEYISGIQKEKPVEIIMWIDHNGEKDVADITDEETIQKMVDLFCKIKIADEAQEWVTDHYNGLQFVFADGTKETIRFNLKNLELSVYHGLRIYELEGLTEFWNAMNEYTVPEYADYGGGS